MYLKLNCYALFGANDGITSSTMAALFGQVGEFVEGQEEWLQYAERLGHYLAVNDIEGAERKRSLLLSVIGPRAFNLLGSLVAPAKPGEKTYDELNSIMTQHHSPLPSEIIQRYQFHISF